MNENDRQAFIREQEAKRNPAPAPAPEDLRFTQAQYDAFMREAQRINSETEGAELLTKAHLDSIRSQGYEFRNEVGAQIIRDGEDGARVTAYLSSTRGQADRAALLNVIHSKSQSLREYDRIKGTVKRNQLYEKPIFLRDENSQTDEYIVQRRRDLMHGIRRAR